MEIEGVRKFDINHIYTSIDSEIELEKLIFIRNELYKRKFIGEDSLGVGYGNLSIRLTGEKFVVTGSQTGNIKELKREHFSVIESVHFEEFSLESYGLIQPSSESITHAAIYQIFSNINAIIHVHAEEFWKWMLSNDYLKTNEVEYGTKEMIEEVRRLYINRTISLGSIFAMTGHIGGIISFGVNLEEANKILLQLYSNYSTQIEKV